MSRMRIFVTIVGLLTGAGLMAAAHPSGTAAGAAAGASAGTTADSAAGAAAGAAMSCRDCLTTRYWKIAADDYDQTGKASFPEHILPELKERLDLGISFSGGGTRSAAASLGQLRGLEELGWLRHVRYVSAVSGGGWTAIPFTYSKQPLDTLLGPYTAPGDLTLDMVRKNAVGTLGQAVAKSSLLSGALREGPAIFLDFRNRRQTVPNPLLKQIVSLTNRLRREGARSDKTFARMLGRLFIDSLIEKNGSTDWFSWSGLTVAEMAGLNPNRLGTFVLAPIDRPFLITNGTLVSARQDYVNPLLMPVEYTPMYIGVRQRFGRFGGTYVWPWAYDPEGIGTLTPDQTDASRGTLQVKLGTGRRLTLADVAASTGAAPEVAILNAFGFDGPSRERIQGLATFFPHFKHIAIGGAGGADGATLTRDLPHADGGGIDNLGIMALLARQVRNVIVFNNTLTENVEDNAEMMALFIPNQTATVSSDSRGNQVFDAALWDRVRTDLAAKRHKKEPQVFCANNWTVLKNQRFNIRGYTGLNICFVYNASSDAWEKLLPPDVRKLLTDKRSPRGTGKLDNFPYFRTFEQNIPHLIKLTTTQVNLLSNLTAWTVYNEGTADVIRGKMPSLPCPTGRVCAS